MGTGQVGPAYQVALKMKIIFFFYKNEKTNVKLSKTERQTAVENLLN